MLFETTPPVLNVYGLPKSFFYEVLFLRFWTCLLHPSRLSYGLLFQGCLHCSFSLLVPFSIPKPDLSPPSTSSFFDFLAGPVYVRAFLDTHNPLGFDHVCLLQHAFRSFRSAIAWYDFIHLILNTLCKHDISDHLRIFYSGSGRFHGPRRDQDDQRWPRQLLK